MAAHNNDRTDEVRDSHGIPDRPHVPLASKLDGTEFIDDEERARLHTLQRLSPELETLIEKLKIGAVSALPARAPGRKNGFLASGHITQPETDLLLFLVNTRLNETRTRARRHSVGGWRDR